MDWCRDYRREAWKNQLGPSCGGVYKLLDSQFRTIEGIEKISFSIPTKKENVNSLSPSTFEKNLTFSLEFLVIVLYKVF